MIICLFSVILQCKGYLLFFIARKTISRRDSMRSNIKRRQSLWSEIYQAYYLVIPKYQTLVFGHFKHKVGVSVMKRGGNHTFLLVVLFDP